ncbi:MAG: hypothetical protein ACRDHM_11470, partial [Actinomycetota bacterium]
MTSPTTARGGPVVVAGPSCAAVLSYDVPPLADALHAAVTSPEPLSEVVLVLARSLSSTLPAFAVVLPEHHQARVLVRGAMSVKVSTADGEVSVASIDDVSTW